MKNILKNAEKAEELLKLTSDTMILLDRNGICVDIAVYNVDMWFLKEDRLLGKNILRLLPPVTYRQVYPEFKKVLARREVSSRNYELAIGDTTYFFKCIMRPYEDMVLCQYRDITERSQRKLKLEKTNRELNEIQKAALIGRWQYDSGKKSFCYTGHSGVMCTEEEQEILLEDYKTHILPEDREVFGKWLMQNLQGDMEASIDYRIHFRKRVFYIRLKTFSYEKQPDGNILLEGYIQNITDIQQRRNDINLLTHAINNSTEDIFAAHEDGTLVFANRRFREHHNIGVADDISELNIYRIDMNTPGGNFWQGLLHSLKKGEKRSGFVLYNPLPDHPEVLAMEGSAYWVTSDKGEAILWGFGRDITQRIKNEQQIKRFSQILDKTIENLPAGIVVKDIRSGFKYLYRNRESYNRNIPLKEALGKDDFDFYPLRRRTGKENAGHRNSPNRSRETLDYRGARPKRQVHLSGQTEDTHRKRRLPPYPAEHRMGHHRNGTDEAGTARGQRESGDFRPIEVSFPCQYEPRDTHPAQCHRRLLQNHRRKYRR